MAKQTVTLRLDEDDLTYLAGIDVPGAANLSEKIRALLADARAQRDGLGDFGAAYDFTRRLFSTPERCVRDAEVRTQVRSELIARVLAWMPDTAAFMLSSACPRPDPRRKDDTEHLRRLEHGLGERVLALVDSMLQLAHAGFPGCYDPATLAQRSRSAVGMSASAPASAAPGTVTHREERK